MATYNGERYLEEQMASVLGQTWSNLEVLVVDDNSTDSTPAILERLGEQDERIRVVNYPDRVGATRNFERALGLVSGDYVALCDQDDVWVPEKLATVMDRFADAEMVFSDMSVIDGEGRTIERSFARFSPYAASSEVEVEDLLFRRCVYGCTMCFRRELLERALPFPAHVAHHDWWLAICARCRAPLRYLDEQLVRYRRHGGNASDELSSQTFAGKLSALASFESHRRRVEARRIIVEQLGDLKALACFQSPERSALLTDAIFFYDSYTANELSMRVLAILRRLSGLLFPKSWYGIAEVGLRLFDRVRWGRGEPAKPEKGV